VPLDNITKDAAPTVVVPGSHRWKIDCQTGHFESGNKLSLCPGYKQLTEESGYWKPVVVTGMKKGDVLFIDTRVLHGWAPNSSIAPHRLALRLTIKPDASVFYQPIQFHSVGPKDVVAPEIWPQHPATRLAQAQQVTDGAWPVPEPPFSEFALFSLAMLNSAIKHRFFYSHSETFRPYGPLLNPASASKSKSPASNASNSSNSRVDSNSSNELTKKY